jgi:hypothetical protein
MVLDYGRGGVLREIRYRRWAARTHHGKVCVHACTVSRARGNVGYYIVSVCRPDRPDLFGRVSVISTHLGTTVERPLFRAVPCRFRVPSAAALALRKSLRRRVIGLHSSGNDFGCLCLCVSSEFRVFKSMDTAKSQTTPF